jgi:hypothetical protein
VSLIGLVSGTKVAPYGLGLRPFTRATFEVKEKGRPTEAWLPDQMEASDATGNEAWVPMVNCDSSNGLVHYEIQCTSLSPSEAWRIQARFCEQGGPAAKQLWRSPELVVRDGALLATKLKTNVQSFLITLECEQSPFHNTIRLKLKTPPKDTHLRAPEIVDDQGRMATYESGGFGDSEFDAQWKLPDGAKWMTVRVSLAETRTIEFVARPTPAPRGLR